MEKEISDAELEYHTYTKEKDKVLKLVIKGLPTKVSVDFINKELKNNNIQAIEVKHMTINFRKIKDQKPKYQFLLPRFHRTRKATKILFKYEDCVIV